MSCMVVCTCAVLVLAVSPVYTNDNVKCELRRIVEHVVGDSGEAGKAIELLQCMGPYMEKQRCAATEWDLVTIPSSDTSSEKLFSYRNHTKCAMRCSKNGSGRSSRICNDTDKYLIACPAGAKWDFREGKCYNDLSLECSKGGNDGSDNSIPLSMFILAMVVELIVVVVAVFLIRDACKYHQNRESGVFYKTSEYVRSLSSGRPNEGNITLRKDRSDTGSESFLPHYSTSNGKINHV